MCYLKKVIENIGTKRDAVNRIMRERIILGENLPECRNCIYFIPIQNNSSRNIDETQKYIFSKCNKFGEKNLINGAIDYSYASICRKYETKCGKEGKYFIHKEEYYDETKEF
jgi:hypothetical protein